VGAIEGGVAPLKLAHLYERTDEEDQAAAAYTQYIQVGGWALLKLAVCMSGPMRRTRRPQSIPRGRPTVGAIVLLLCLKETEGQGIPDRDDQGQAYKFLGNYHLRLDQLTQVPGTGFLKINIKMLNSKNSCIKPSGDEKLDFCMSKNFI
jgi:hypothetical protein